MEPWGFEPQIPPCHGGVIPFHYGPAALMLRRGNFIRVGRSVKRRGHRGSSALRESSSACGFARRRSEFAKPQAETCGFESSLLIPLFTPVHACTHSPTHHSAASASIAARG